MKAFQTSAIILLIVFAAFTVGYLIKLLGFANHGCISVSQVTNKYTPPDLLKHAAQCLKENKVQDAVFLRTLALTYGRFDTLRVADQSAHQVIMVRTIENFQTFNREKTVAYDAALQKTVKDPKRFAAFYQSIERVGMPNYYPRYMIQHGMGSPVALVPNFDAKTAWKKALEETAQLPNMQFTEPGSLESTHAIGCIEPSKISNQYTPVDLHHGVLACIKENNLKNAVFMSILARSYIEFDSARAIDPEAPYNVHNAILQKHREKIDMEKRIEGGKEYINMTTEPEGKKEMCNAMKRIGMPNYYPRYAMPENSVKPNFNPALEWKRLLFHRFKCPVPFTGNMAPTHQLGCVTADKLSNKYTPLDLLTGYAQCLKEKKFAEADFIYALAFVYLYFDKARIADKTDGSQIPFRDLRDKAEDSLSPQELKFNQDYKRSEKETVAMCKAIKKIGMPDYYPRYMTANGLLPDFDVKKEWEKQFNRMAPTNQCQFLEF